MARRTNTDCVTAELDGVTLRLPSTEPDPETYIARENGHIDMHLRGVAVDAFRRVHAGLIEDGAKLANGRPVSSKAHVLQWLFERAAE